MRTELQQLTREANATIGATLTVRELLHMIADDGYTFLYNGSILSIINTPQWFIEKGDAYGYTEELDTLVEDYYLTKERNGSFVWNIVTIITDEQWLAMEAPYLQDNRGFDYDPDYSPMIDRDAYTM